MRVRVLVSALFAALAVTNFIAVAPASAAPSSIEDVRLAPSPAARAAAVSGTAPVLDPVSDMTVDAGTSADQALHASDADGDPLSFYRSAGPTFMTVTTTAPGTGSATGNVHLSPGAIESSVYNAVVGVSDGQFNAQSPFQITVIQNDQAPLLAQPSDMTMRAGQVQDQQLTASDPDGDALTFSKQSGPLFVTVTTTDPGAGTAYGSVSAAPQSYDAGTYPVTVVADDGALTDQKSFLVTVRANNPPTLNFVNDMYVRAGNTGQQSLYANDSDGDSLTFSKAAGPGFMTVTTNYAVPGTAYGLVTLTPSGADVGTTGATVRVSDGALSAERSFTITVTPPDRPPVMNQPADMTAIESQITEQGVSASDPDGDYMFIYEQSGPAYMTVFGGSGYGSVAATIRLAPTATDIGSATGSLTVYANGVTDTKSFTITVIAGDFPPFCGADTFTRYYRFYGYGLIEVQSADLNSDGILDLLFEMPDDNRAATALGNGDGTFGDASDLDAGTYPVSGTIGDWNGDGAPDLAVLDTGGGRVHAFLGHGDGTFASSGSFVSGGARSIVSADVDRDGDLDLLVANPNSEGVGLLRGNGNGTFGAAGNVASGLISWHLATPDLNGDGAPDLVVADPSAGIVAVFRNNGSGGFGARTDYAVGGSVYAVAGADVDANGTIDVIATDATSNRILVFPGDGAGGLGAPKTSSTGGGPRQIAVADWNGDGYLDLATPNLETNNATLLLGNGTGAFGSRVDFPGLDGPYGIVAGDFDDDLRPDFVVANYYGGAIASFLNRCAPDRDHPPIVKAPSKANIAEQSRLSITVTATDPDGPSVASLTADLSDLPLGHDAAFVASPDFAQGTFTWTPDYQSARQAPWPVRFIASNVLADTATTKITVTNVNRPPAANAGGPYASFLGTPVAFDGSASSDPDGEALTYAWVFGDGKTGTGAKPTHQYPALGVYGVALTVSDGTATGLATTTASIVGVFEARAFTLTGNRTIRLSSGKPQWCVELEPVDRSYSNVTVDLTSIVMKSAGTGSVSEIHANVDKTAVLGDRDGNGIDEITACFAKQDLRALFADLHGQTTVTVAFEGSLFTGGRFRAQLDVTVIASGGALAASITPNPLNPDAVLSFRTERPGRVRVEVFDLNGRLVDRLLDEPDLAAGYHDVRIAARREGGVAMASGIYFYRIDAAEGTQSGRFTVLK